jgi:hypothetical protein
MSANQNSEIQQFGWLQRARFPGFYWRQATTQLLAAEKLDYIYSIYC